MIDFSLLEITKNNTLINAFWLINNEMKLEREENINKMKVVIKGQKRR